MTASKTQSTNHYKELLEGTRDIVLSVNHKYELLYINKAGKLAFDEFFSTNMEPGINVLEVVPEFLAKIWKERYDRALSGESYVLLEEYQGELGGEPDFFELRFYPVHEGKKITATAVVSRNVTDYKRKEFELQEGNKRLEKLANEKERLLQNL
ncbi:MAG: PAS domain-containing protein, partial [Cyclobacteriaceae bacterium]